MSKFFGLVAEHLIVPPSSGFDRGSMPQIKDLDGFEKFVNSKGVGTKTINVPALQLIGSQNNLDMEKVSGISKNKEYGKLLVTSDMQVIDGHHRWAAAFNNGDNVSALVVDLPIQELLNFASEFSGTKYTESILLEMAYPEGFNLSDLKNIRSFKGKTEYVRSKLGKQLGKGSSRIVFPVDDSKVLKLAWNRRGIAQNEAEVGASSTHDITAEVFDYADDYSWIEMEKTTPIKSSAQLKSKIGFDQTELARILDKMHFDATGKTNDWRYPVIMPAGLKDWDDVWEEGFLRDLISFLVDYDLLDRVNFASEFSQPKHFGVNSKGEIKLIDYGLNTSVFDEFYKRSNVVWR